MAVGAKAPDEGRTLKRKEQRAFAGLWRISGSTLPGPSRRRGVLWRGTLATGGLKRDRSIHRRIQTAGREKV